MAKGTFTPWEATTVVMSMIDEKINFHKVQKLQLWEGNHKFRTGPLEGRIEELEHGKKAAAAFIEKTSVAKALGKANDWAETRPEWGLAKNAVFIIAPRTLPKTNNLEGRCFLHSYDWQIDRTGKALEGIVQGPMVVTQWINNHYYFSTVDMEKFGAVPK